MQHLLIHRFSLLASYYRMLPLSLKELLGFHQSIGLFFLCSVVSVIHKAVMKRVGLLRNHVSTLSSVVIPLISEDELIQFFTSRIVRFFIPLLGITSPPPHRLQSFPTFDSKHPK